MWKRLSSKKQSRLFLSVWCVGVHLCAVQLSGHRLPEFFVELGVVVYPTKINHIESTSKTIPSKNRSIPIIYVPVWKPFLNTDSSEQDLIDGRDNLIRINEWMNNACHIHSRASSLSAWPCYLDHVYHFIFVPIIFFFSQCQSHQAKTHFSGIVQFNENVIIFYSLDFYSV